MLELELLRGRRAGFVTVGIGAWLVIGPGSNMSSWKICKGSFPPKKCVGLAILASQCVTSFYSDCAW
jgi:hypothetical protein